MNRAKAIQKHCFVCAGESAKEVTFCSCYDCTLWEYRTGNNPDSLAYKRRMKTAAKNYPDEMAEMVRNAKEIGRSLEPSSNRRRKGKTKSADPCLGMAKKDIRHRTPICDSTAISAKEG